MSTVEEAIPVCGQEAYENSLYFLVSSAVNLKLLFNTHTHTHKDEQQGSYLSVIIQSNEKSFWILDNWSIDIISYSIYWEIKIRAHGVWEKKFFKVVKYFQQLGWITNSNLIKRSKCRKWPLETLASIWHSDFNDLLFLSIREIS